MHILAFIKLILTLYFAMSFALKDGELDHYRNDNNER